MRDGWQELSGAPFVGVASEAGFAAGYKCKGSFFGGPGNLSDGGALVRSHFGEPICQGDVVGVSLTSEEGELTVTFYHNGRCLGPAFRSNELTLFPVVQAKGQGDSFRIDFKAMPKIKHREGDAWHPFDGEWRLTKLRIGHEDLKCDEFRLVVQQKDLEVNLSFKIVNYLSFRAECNRESLTVRGPGRSTMMAGPETLLRLEQQLCAAIEELRTWSIHEDMLTLQGPELEISCTRKLQRPVVSKLLTSSDEVEPRFD